MLPKYLQVGESFVHFDSPERNEALVTLLSHTLVPASGGSSDGRLEREARQRASCPLNTPGTTASPGCVDRSLSQSFGPCGLQLPSLLLPAWDCLWPGEWTEKWSVLPLSAIKSSLSSSFLRQLKGFFQDSFSPLMPTSRLQVALSSCQGHTRGENVVNSPLVWQYCKFWSSPFCRLLLIFQGFQIASHIFCRFWTYMCSERQDGMCLLHLAWDKNQN